MAKYSMLRTGVLLVSAAVRTAPVEVLAHQSSITRSSYDQESRPGFTVQVGGPRASIGAKNGKPWLAPVGPGRATVPRCHGAGHGSGPGHAASDLGQAQAVASPNSMPASLMLSADSNSFEKELPKGLKVVRLSLPISRMVQTLTS